MRWTIALLPLLTSVVPTLAQDNGGVAEYVQTVLGALE